MIQTTVLGLWSHVLSTILHVTREFVWATSFLTQNLFSPIPWTLLTAMDIRKGGGAFTETDNADSQNHASIYSLPFTHGHKFLSHHKLSTRPLPVLCFDFSFLLAWCFSTFNVHRNHLGILVNCMDPGYAKKQPF